MDKAGWRWVVLQIHSTHFKVLITNESLSHIENGLIHLSPVM